ncbi:MAG: GTPase HflX [Gammaproteobacteria bacterium]|nr:GTPase HflX [Gammaproteobacteria bacterium]
MSSRGIVVRQLYAPPRESDHPLRELSELASSAGVEVLYEFLPVRRVPVASTFIGKGKAEELAGLVSELEIDLVVFDHPITPVQERNLERVLNCRVLGRSGLILDIFALRATSSEGKLQVELAQLKHLSTRLVRGWSHLERQKGGIGLRGPGETQLETDRRLIGDRIKTLTQRLDKVESQRQLRRRARHRTPVPTVSLVGYTNAGKSSLFNMMSGANVLVEDKLFATLDPTMRRVDLPGFGEIVLSDTVGFIRDLPHTLVAAFHSTLEEVVSASCLLLVNDVSDPDHLELRAQVEMVLDEIGASDVPVIYVNNKIDLIAEESRVRRSENGLVDRVWLSAESGDGVRLLQEAVSGFLSSHHEIHTMLLKPQAGALRAKLYQRCEVMNETVDDEGNMLLEVKMDASDKGWIDAQAQFTELWEDVSA